MSRSRAAARRPRSPERNWTGCSTLPVGGSRPSPLPRRRPSANGGRSPDRDSPFHFPPPSLSLAQINGEGIPMHRTLVLGAILSAGPAFGQGLGVTPAVPENSSLTITPLAG